LIRRSLSELRESRNLVRLYDLTGEHLNADGHGALARIVANQFMAGAAPAFSTIKQSQSEKMQQKPISITQQK
jgi:hypothetical protein